MRCLWGAEAGRDLSHDDVADLYRWPEEGRWVRAMMVTTLDGAAAGPDGLSGSISSEADKAVFDAVRRFADAVLIGAGTLRAERYRPMRAQDADAERRRAAGQLPAPTLVVVSGSLDLPWSEPVFAESAQTPIVVTGTDADPMQVAWARTQCDLEVVDSPRPSAGDVVAVLERRGLRRIVCEGGPTLLDEFVRTGLLDEADISLSPGFAGTAHSPNGVGPESVAWLRLEHVLTADDFLMMRYVRHDA